MSIFLYFTNRERFRAKYMPRIAGWMVALAASRARRKLKRIGPISVLIDNCTIGYGVTHETVRVNDHARKCGYLARVPVWGLENTSEEHRNATYLPGISYLNCLGLINLFTSAELFAERFSQPVGLVQGVRYM